MLGSSSRSIRRFAQQRAQRFQWQTLLKPWTPKSTVDRFKGVEGDILMKTKYVNSIPTTVEPIDWEHWDSVIKAPGVVAALKEEYEGHVFDDVDTTTDVKGAADVEKEIFDLEVKSNIASVELAACDKVIDETIKMKTDMLEWKIEDWYNKIPGLKQELVDDWEEEEYLPTAADERSMSVDYAALSEDVAQGKLDTDPISKPEKIGDLTLAEIEEAKANGTWTIATFLKSKAERQELYAERQKLVDSVKADLLKA